jgi:hypothetical protein
MFKIIFLIAKDFFINFHENTHKKGFFFVNFIRIIGLLGILISQEIPQDYHKYKIDRFIIDYENNFTNLSTFGPIRYKNTDEKDTSDIKFFSYTSRYGIGFKNNSHSISLSGKYLLNSYLYGYHYSRIVGKPAAYERFSGVTQNNSRLGLKSGETDLSGVGFNNDWLIMQIGRGRQSWGAGSELQLVLNELSSPYDYFMLNFDLGQIRARYIHGYLESDSTNYNRYLTGRGIEWTNNKSLVLSLNEIVVYSGLNRPLDFSYLNPFITHLEVEPNYRNNDFVKDGNRNWNNANGIWQASLYYKFNDFLRASFNFLIDEFVLDKVEDLKNKEHGVGYSMQFSLRNRKLLDYKIIHSCSFVKIGTPTFRHGNGRNNFVVKAKPLGWEYGSDTYELKYNFNYLKSENLFINLNFGIIEIGDESIINRPYDKYVDYISDSYPSGNTTKQIFFGGEFEYYYKKNISFYMNFNSKNVELPTNKNNIEVGFDLYFLKTNNNVIFDIIDKL